MPKESMVSRWQNDGSLIKLIIQSGQKIMETCGPFLIENRSRRLYGNKDKCASLPRNFFGMRLKVASSDQTRIRFVPNQSTQSRQNVEII